MTRRVRDDTYSIGDELRDPWPLFLALGIHAVHRLEVVTSPVVDCPVDGAPVPVVFPSLWVAIEFRQFVQMFDFSSTSIAQRTVVLAPSHCLHHRSGFG